jgi:hypothetical protein
MLLIYKEIASKPWVSILTHASGKTRRSAGMAATLTLNSTVVMTQPRAVDGGIHKADGTAKWLTYGLNQAETHYGTFKQIDASNAGKVGLVRGPLSWARAQEATRLVWNNTSYGITTWISGW